MMKINYENQRKTRGVEYSKVSKVSKFVTISLN